MHSIRTQRDLQVKIHAFIKAKKDEKAAKAEAKKLSDELISFASEMDIKTLESGDTKLTVVAATTVTGFDTDRFKADYPELYKAYCTKVSNRSAYIK